MPTNRLINEKSPYLLQHAHNPVDWYAWNEEAFDKARSEDKPIFLSIGYSTCHWCHVMERESFESEEIATVLNRHFVPIKIDREERPDVDRIYMAFVQASTGSGGWPMSVWLTPELKPFFGGTYFPPDNRYGRPGFLYLLQQLANSWATERSRIVESSEGVISQLALQGLGTESGELDPAWLESAFFTFRRAFDSRHGGFGPAPKFPRPSALNFLFRYAVQAKNEEASDMALATLRAMAHGGMHDHLGGGFHRYSVDNRWFVPHFEKMLYDQAQLAISYLEAFQVSGDSFFADIARGIFDYVLGDMTHLDGGFYSAEDADSVIDPSDLQTKGEGAFYVWTQDELDELLGRSSEAFCRHYGVEASGNVHEDPHHEFEGKNILFEQDSPPGPFAAEKTILLAERNKRFRPHLDDKILTAWNGLMISAFAKGAGILNEPRYLTAAQRAFDFLAGTLRDGTRILRRFRDGDAAIPGFLDDYTFLTQAALDLYAADLNPARLAEAVSLADATLELFEDADHGGFFATAAGDTSLVMRLKEDYDGAEPSGNSIAVSNLLRLAHITGDDRYRQSADRTLKLFASRLKSASSGVPQMMAAFLLSLTPPRQVVVAGASPDELLRVYRSRFLPYHTLLAVNSGNRAEIISIAPSVAPMAEVEGKATAYVCENFACQLPTTSGERLAELLD